MTRPKGMTDRAHTIQRALRCCPKGYAYKNFLTVCRIFGVVGTPSEIEYRRWHKALYGITPAEAWQRKEDKRYG